MAETIFEEISNQAENLTLEDIDSWVLPSVMDVYDRKLRYLAFKSYGGGDVPEVAILAFKESAKEELRAALSTFLFNKEHWRNDRDINPYLRLCLNRFAQRKINDNNAIKMKNAPVCPLCRESGAKNVLQLENGALRCYGCTAICERLNKEIENGKTDLFTQCKLNIHSKFALHSKKGFSCQECNRFIPKSLILNDKVTCPYDNCLFSGHISDLDERTHPTVSVERKSLELSDQYTGESKPKVFLRQQNGRGSALRDMSADASTDAYYALKVQFEQELNILNTVVEEQIVRIKRTNTKATKTQKILMYKAFQKMINNHPIEMVSYLVHKKQKSEFPIQARIFQTYASLIENHMPITIENGEEEKVIFDLTDPDLSLFNGISEFDTKVKNNNTIPNRTKEEYIGGRNYKNYGPCFIGKVIDIIDESGESIKDKIIDYSFSKIIMSNDVVPGTKVKVKHYRILSHYEMDSLVFLQRTRRDIVDSVHFRLNNEKRQARK